MITRGKEHLRTACGVRALANPWGPQVHALHLQMGAMGCCIVPHLHAFVLEFLPNRSLCVPVPQQQMHPYKCNNAAMSGGCDFVKQDKNSIGTPWRFMPSSFKWYCTATVRS